MYFHIYTLASPHAHDNIRAHEAEAKDTVHLLHISGAYALHNNLNTTALRKRKPRSIDVCSIHACPSSFWLQANAAGAIAAAP